MQEGLDEEVSANDSCKNETRVEECPSKINRHTGNAQKSIHTHLLLRVTSVDGYHSETELS